MRSSCLAKRRALNSKTASSPPRAAPTQTTHSDIPFLTPDRRPKKAISWTPLPCTIQVPGARGALALRMAAQGLAQATCEPMSCGVGYVFKHVSRIRSSRPNTYRLPQMGPGGQRHGQRMQDSLQT